MRPLVVLLMGPTASGKTDLACALHERLPCDLISVDSALVYRGMDIGTAKPEPELLERAPHRLIDILEPTESYSAARFRIDALREIDAILASGRIPLLVGGTMLYFRALTEGLSALPDADPTVRRALAADAAEHGWEALHARLRGLDPEAARRIHPHDPQRIGRALEVIALTGRPLSELQRRRGEPSPYRFLKLVRAPAARQVLHERIAARFREMVARGFEAEVARLMELQGFSRRLSSMRAVGYRQMIGYLDGEYGHAEMVERGIAATRQLAKRQFTWLRREQDVDWIGDERAASSDRVAAQITAVVR